MQLGCVHRVGKAIGAQRKLREPVVAAVVGAQVVAPVERVETVNDTQP
jgi:hypothetical protein